jgi:hypothetical protein
MKDNKRASRILAHVADRLRKLSAGDTAVDGIYHSGHRPTVTDLIVAMLRAYPQDLDP